MYKVMLVEDEELIRTGLKRLIEDVIGGFTVIAECRNGREALQSLKQTMPDLIITDIRMKEMNGVEMIGSIRDDFPDLSILVLSGYDDFEYVRKALHYKVDDYMLKPIDRVEFTQYLTRFKKRMDERKQALTPHFTEGGSKEKVTESEKKIIREVKAIIHDALDQDISLQFIADKIHINRQYLSALFKTETGINYSDYVKQCKMERAKKLLVETNLKIYEIAQLAGYDNPKYFMTVFKQYAGISASEYRDSYHK